jgi:hypothetical protein
MVIKLRPHFLVRARRLFEGSCAMEVLCRPVEKAADFSVLSVEKSDAAAALAISRFLLAIETNPVAREW